MAITQVNGVTINKLTLSQYKELQDNNELVNNEIYNISDIADYLEATIPVINLDNYTRNNLPTTLMNYSIKYINGYFFITGSTGNLLTSTDGINWTQHNVGTDQTDDVIYFNNKYIVTQVDRCVKYSSDLISWTRASTIFNCYGLASNESMIVAGGAGIVRSSDGVTWTQSLSNIHSGNDTINRICYGNGLFVAVGTNGTILTSSDGINWTDKSIGITHDLYDVIYANGLFIAVGYQTIVYSTDGVTWEFGIQNGGRDYEKITYLDKTFYIISGNTLVTTTDAIEYTLTSTNITSDPYINGITNDGTKLAIVSRYYVYLSVVGKKANLQEITNFILNKI